MKAHANLYYFRACVIATIGVLMVLMVGPASDSLALVRHPNQGQVKQAIKRGMDFAQRHRPPNELYWQFGTLQQFEPRGFLVSKLSGLAVMASHYALRGEEPNEHDIQRLLAENTLQVVVTVFGHSPSFAQDSYLIMKQGENVVKPNRIRFDARAREVGGDQELQVYRAKIVGVFPYENVKLESPTTLLVFPGDGGEIHFELDLSTIP